MKCTFINLYANIMLWGFGVLGFWGFGFRVEHAGAEGAGVEGAGESPCSHHTNL